MPFMLTDRNGGSYIKNIFGHIQNKNGNNADNNVTDILISILMHRR